VRPETAWQGELDRRRDEPFLIQQFRELYREVIRLKSRVQHGDWAFDLAQAEEGDPGAEAAPSAIWQRLLTLLERQDLAARRRGGDFAAEVYRHARYVMAALADEVFLHLDWPGREAWGDHLLESKLFGSHRAGEVVFERIDELLRQRDAVYVELAKVYLLALSLGFEGKFRGRPDAAAHLDAYRKRLFHFIFNQNPRLYQGAEHLMPGTYASTLDQGRPRKLPYLKRWFLAGAVLIALWIGASYLAWNPLIKNMTPSIERILTTSSP
jgi:type VI secretion system protein ImpK